MKKLPINFLELAANSGETLIHLKGPFPGVSIEEIPCNSARNSCMRQSNPGEMLASNPTVKKPVPKIDLSVHHSRGHKVLTKQPVATGAMFSPGLPLPKVESPAA